MTELLLDCPNCGGAQVGFVPRFRWGCDKLLMQMLAVCNNCRRGVLLTYAHPAAEAKLANNNWWPHRDIESTHIQTDPAPRSTDGPDHLPQNVASVYRQALDNLYRRNWDGAGMLCRRALDLATKIVQLNGNNGASRKLAQRIDELERRRLITPDLKDWAHHIRMLGNEAAHEEEAFDEHTAKEIIEFTELFFRYVFTLPEMLRQSRLNGS